IPPYLSFSVTDLRHVGTFAVMLVVALVISGLTKRIRDQAATARQREERAARLYAMSRELAGTSSLEEVGRIAQKHLGEAFDAATGVVLPDPAGKLDVASAEGSLKVERNDAAVADWVWTHGKLAGLGTDTLPSASARFMILRGGRGKVGIVAIRPE